MTEAEVITLSPFRRDVAEALAKRGKHLLGRDDLAQVVPTLQPLEAYFIVKELGVDSALPILKHTTAPQLQAFVDLDCWEGDSPSAEDLDAWLSPFAAQGELALASAFVSLDAELQAHYLAQVLMVFDTREEEDPPVPKDATTMTTPDTYFLLYSTARDPEVDPLYLVGSLYKHDLNEAFRLIMAAKWELPTPLAEQAYQFRRARLEELGFPAAEEAMAIFARPPVKAPGVSWAGGGTKGSRSRKHHTKVADARTRLVAIDAGKAAAGGNQGAGGAVEDSEVEPRRLPALYAAPVEEDLLFHQALGQCRQPGLLSHLEQNLVALVNHAVIAFGGTPRDLRRVREVAQQVAHTVSLGLEVLLERESTAATTTVSESNGSDGGDEQRQAMHARAVRAADLLAQWPLPHVFQYGYHAVQPLAQQARVVAADPVVGQWLKQTETAATDYGEDRMDREFLRALVDRHPALGGYDRVKPEQRQPFTTRQQVEDGHTRLDAIAKRVS